MSERQRFPEWIKKRLPGGPEAAQTRRLVERLALATVCNSAKCPNIWECYGRKVATFMLLGNTCTRGCTFCGVQSGAASLSSGPPDPDEPQRVAEAVNELGLRHAVITSVTRDDLPDGGAAHFAATIEAVRALNPDVTVEVLTPDFLGSRDAVSTVLEARPDVFNHNVETVPRLYPEVRPKADYGRSLDVLHTAKQLQPGMLTKSGLMVGLGETRAEVEAVLGDLRGVAVDVVTIGQYLQPTKRHRPVAAFIEPAAFEELEAHALRLGFAAAFCGPFVRSSYHAAEVLTRAGGHLGARTLQRRDISP